MMTAEDVARLMLILVPLILTVVVVGYFQFMKWSRKDRDAETLKAKTDSSTKSS